MEASLRLFITLTWAQGLDGSIAAAPGTRTAISGAESLAMTHRLRAAHDGILIGVGTVLADDPSLTVRFAEGEHPRPVVLDARLRTPPSARLLGPGARGALIIAASPADAERRIALESAGARVLALAPGADGRPPVTDLLAALHAEGLRRLMVEGGAMVIAAFLAAGLADELVVTISPRIVAGLNPFCGQADSLRESCRSLRTEGARWERYGDDIVLSARIQR